MDYVEIPQTPKGARPWMFLAGGITGCHLWQNEVIHGLDDFEHGTIINPRRADWDMDDPHVAEEQIRLEHQAIHQCDIFSVWFTDETLQPITMFEIGVALTRFRMGDPRLKALVIGVHENFERRFDVDEQVKWGLQGVGDKQRKKVWICHDFNIHMENMKLAIDKIWKESGYAKTC